jgi:hypothetical protein
MPVGIELQELDVDQARARAQGKAGALAAEIVRRMASLRLTLLRNAAQIAAPVAR